MAHFDAEDSEVAASQIECNEVSFLCCDGKSWNTGRDKERRKRQYSSGSFTEHQFTTTVCEVKIQQYCRKQSSDLLERTLCDVGKEKLTCNTKERVRAFQEYFIHWKGQHLSISVWDFYLQKALNVSIVTASSACLISVSLNKYSESGL